MTDEGRMNSSEVAKIVALELARYQYRPPDSGSTVGVPWSEERILGYVERLRKSLVKPYLQRFLLRETFDQTNNREGSFAEYWVIAKDGNDVEWYDPSTKEFGLGQYRENTVLPISIGVRGDLVGVFCSI